MCTEHIMCTEHMRHIISKGEIKLMSDKKFHTKKETAEILGVNPKTVERYLLSGKLKGARLGKAWKISDDDIQAFYDDAKKETAKALKERNKAMSK